MKPVTIKNKLLSLGSGKTTNSYEYEITGTGELSNVTVNQIIEANQDAATYFTNYVYCKLLGITITIIPSNVSGEVLANIRWDGATIPTVQDLKQDNSTRRVPTNVRNYRNIFIKIPPITVYTTNSYPIQLNKMINTSKVLTTTPLATGYKFPGILYLLIPQGVIIRMTVKVGFRQNEVSTANFTKSIKAELLNGNTYDMLINQIEQMKIEQKEDEEMEEEKEIIDEKQEEEDEKEEVKEDVKSLKLEKKIEKEINKQEKPKEEENNKEVKEEEEDVWFRDPLLDRKPRWSAAKKKEMKLKRIQQEMKMNIKINKDN